MTRIYIYIYIYIYIKTGKEMKLDFCTQSSEFHAKHVYNIQPIIIKNFLVKVSLLLREI